MILQSLCLQSLSFPPVSQALDDPNGLLAWGGDLSSERLLSAYRQGIFPWFSPGDPILWWSPNPRAILWPEQFHISRSFKRFLKHNTFVITINKDFAQVIALCASTHQEDAGWLTDEMIQAYQRLHQSGHAHSLEVWQNNRLVGGLYGIAQGRLFCAESMFSLQTNGSKVALAAFCHYFSQQGGCLIDCQVINEHTQSLGATTLPRQDYLNLLQISLKESLTLNCWQKKQFTFPSSLP